MSQVDPKPPFNVPVVMLVLARFPGRADPAVAHPRLGANQPVVARRVRNELNAALYETFAVNAV